jgi:FAD/FMN-containing dehydrogenase
VRSWSNWSGSVRLPDADIHTPADADELAELLARVRRTGGRLRAIGAGHSFVPFWQPGDHIVSLARFSGILHQESQQVRFGAGTRLTAIGPLLAARGLALANMGDIDGQSLAGAVATGTHGTGLGLGSLSSQVCAMAVLRADGSTWHVDGDAELEAGRVSLGMLGITTAVTLQTVAIYGLHERNRLCGVEASLEGVGPRAAEHRHVEFWWIPRTDTCVLKTLDVIPIPPQPRLDEIPFGSSGERWGPSYRVFPSTRDLEFNEMEYAIPLDSAPDCFRALREQILRTFPKLPWPIEYRLVAGDAGWLSPTQGAPVATLSVHQGADRPWEPLFDLLEPLLRAFGGRPHWGKLHRLDAASLQPLYPRLGEFAALCRRHDPEGVFRNRWLESLLPR